MARTNYRVTITEHDYAYTSYIAWVQGDSKNQALIKAGALAGQEKARREFERTGSPGVEGLLEPDVKMEVAPQEEYWDHREEVEVEGALEAEKRP